MKTDPKTFVFPCKFSSIVVTGRRLLCLLGLYFYTNDYLSMRATIRNLPHSNANYLSIQKSVHECKMDQ